MYEDGSSALRSEACNCEDKVRLYLEMKSFRTYTRLINQYYGIVSANIVCRKQGLQDSR